MIRSELPINIIIILMFLNFHSAAAAASEDLCDRDAMCRMHDSQGLQLVRSKRYSEALQQFRIAYQQAPTPRILISIGRCLYRTGQYTEALSAYEQFKNSDPTADEQTKARVDRYIAEARLAAGLPSVPSVGAGTGSTAALPTSPGESGRGQPLSAGSPPESGRSGSAGVSTGGTADVAGMPAASQAQSSQLASTMAAPSDTRSSAEGLTRFSAVPWGAGLLLGGGGVLLATGLGLGVAAGKVGQSILRDTGPYDGQLYQLGTELNISAISCDILGALMASTGLVIKISTSLKQRSRSRHK